MLKLSSGMMNNGWYVVRYEAESAGKLLFHHPYNQTGTSTCGWMKPSVSNRLAMAKQDSDVPDKYFTREEIEKHNKRDDNWLVINGNVYDSTSVLNWHPGGSAALLANAGMLSLEVTTSFNNIHDDYAHKKLAECAIGRVTDKAMKYMQRQAKAEAEKAAKGHSSDIMLNSKRWKPVTLSKKEQLSQDTYSYTFQYRDSRDGGSRTKLGLSTCQHIQFGIHMLDKMLIRSYTPTRPIREDEEDGTFELTIKTYFPDENQPGGAFSNFLHELDMGEQVEVCGPTGEITYLGAGRFNIEGKEQHFKYVSLVLGGSGITPGYALMKRIAEDAQDPTNVAVINANKTEKDILLRSELNDLVGKSNGRLRIAFVLSHPKNKVDWEANGGLSGHVNGDVIKAKLFSPGEDSVVFLCGPPGMIQKAALPALKGQSL
jgi:nitrate reductase (NAD(P)H)